MGRRVIWLALVFAAFALADEVELKGGIRVEGEVVEQTDEIVTIRVAPSGKVCRWRLDQVVAITVDGERREVTVPEGPGEEEAEGPRELPALQEAQVGTPSLFAAEAAAYPALRAAALAGVPQRNPSARAADAGLLSRFKETDGWGDEPNDGRAEHDATEMMQDGKPLSAALAPLLRHSSRAVRQLAIREMGDSGDVIAAQVLSQHLAALIALEAKPRRSGGVGVDVASVAEALGKLGCRGAAPQVYAALLWAANNELRHTPGKCAEALGRLRYAPAAPTLVQMLAMQADYGSRVRAGQDTLLAALNAVTTADVSIKSGTTLWDHIPVGRGVGLNDPYTRDLLDRISQGIRQAAQFYQTFISVAPQGPRERWLKQQLAHCGVVLPPDVGDDPARIIQAMARTYVSIAPARRDVGVEAQAILVGFVKYGHPLVVPALIDIVAMTEGTETTDIMACFRAIQRNAGDVGLAAVGPPRGKGGSFLPPAPPMSLGMREQMRDRWTDWWEENKELLIYKYESLQR